MQGIDYLLKRIGVKQSQMELESHRILATAACSLVSSPKLAFCLFQPPKVLSAIC